MRAGGGEGSAGRAPGAQGNTRAGGRAGDTNAKRCTRCGASYPFDFKVCPKDGVPLQVAVGPQSEDAEDDPLIGEVLAGAYCILGPLGEGGMGRVYEAEHVRLPRKFAVKVVAPELARNAEALGRMEREAQAASRVLHPNVLDVVDVVRVHDGRPCMVTELLQGEELGLMLDRVNKLPLLQAIDICKQTCRGLSAAHAQGIVHRDLKPANLFLCHREGEPSVVKILDFGVAKMMDGAQLTRFGTVVGTPTYMAPEQARGAPDVDARADVYGVGAVLYHLVAGQPPFDDDEPARILSRVVMDNPRPMRQIDPSIPPAIEAIVARAMAKRPEERTPTVKALETELSTLQTYLENAARAQQAPVQPIAPQPAPAPRPVPASAPTQHTIRQAAAPAKPIFIAGIAVTAAVMTVLSIGIVLMSIKSKTVSATLLIVAAVIAAGCGVVVATMANRRSD